MAVSWLEVAKETLGALSAVLMAVPWIRDFGARWTRRDFASVPVEGAMKELTGRVGRRMTHWIDNPKLLDLVCVLAGFLMLCASFAIGLVVALGLAA